MPKLVKRKIIARPPRARKKGLNAFGKPCKEMTVELNPRFVEGTGKKGKPFALNSYSLERRNGRHLSKHEAAWLAEKAFASILKNFGGREKIYLEAFKPMTFLVKNQGRLLEMTFEPERKELERIAEKPAKRKKQRK